MKKPLLIALVCVVQGCITPAICTKEGAYDTGRQTALAGRPADLDHGDVCEGESIATFRTNYQKGYDVGLQLLCSVQNASDDGRDAGLQGQAIQALPLRYQICGTQDKSKLEKAFMASYQTALNAFCSVDSAESRGLESGRANQALEDSDRAYLSCPSSQSKKLKTAYQGAFRRGLREYCQPQNHEEKIREQARNTLSPAYDGETLGRCAREFPEFYEAYNTVFYRERQVVIDSLCTYENGLNTGRADADRLNGPHKGFPVFCDEATSPRFLRGYDRGWTDQKSVICTREDYQEQGFQDGRNGLASDPRINTLCPGEYHSQIRSRYQLGYERGRRAYRPNPTPERPATASADLIQACAAAFSFNDDKLKCIEASTNARRPSDLVTACSQAFSMSADRLSCIKTAPTYHPAAAVNACKKNMTFAGDVQSCIDRVKDARYDPTRTIENCSTAFTLSGDRLECVSATIKSPRDASGRINSCKDSFHFSADVMKCIRVGA